ncbi:hypothetical protein BT96DRAFT_1018542 [Gymnopus androsaceus JB14]|uniref:Uncharacterized protein n=1 Tax=Gymnopus androsaceus JB14 TaxID=1447944 RepID=A0A6A4HVH2_9AGAR|nr:hypothetical protein BT96DRAFT_1018542 [Gymnopus androsaceus JB14]
MTDSESLKRKAENENLALHEPPRKLTSPRKPLQNVSNDSEYHSTESAKKNAGVIVDDLDTITNQTRKEDSIDLDATLVMDSEDSCHGEMKKASEPNSSVSPQLNQDDLKWPLSRLKLVHRSALIHEVVPVVYRENQRLRSVIRLLEERLVLKEAEVGKLQTALENIRQNHQ